MSAEDRVVPLSTKLPVAELGALRVQGCLEWVPIPAPCSPAYDPLPLVGGTLGLSPLSGLCFALGWCLSPSSGARSLPGARGASLTPYPPCASSGPALSLLSKETATSLSPPQFQVFGEIIGNTFALCPWVKGRPGPGPGSLPVMGTAAGHPGSQPCKPGESRPRRQTW